MYFLQIDFGDFTKSGIRDVSYSFSEKPDSNRHFSGWRQHVTLLSGLKQICSQGVPNSEVTSLRGENAASSCEGRARQTLSQNWSHGYRSNNSCSAQGIFLPLSFLLQMELLISTLSVLTFIWASFTETHRLRCNSLILIPQAHAPSNFVIVFPSRDSS